MPDATLRWMWVLGSRLTGKGWSSPYPFSIDAKPRPPADFGAPGIDLEVPWLSGGTIVLTGNSFAAPM